MFINVKQRDQITWGAGLASFNLSISILSKNTRLFKVEENKNDTLIDVGNLESFSVVIST